MKNCILSVVFVLGTLVAPTFAQAAALTTQQSTSLIAVVQSSPGTPASAFVNLITAFSNITVNQTTSLIAVVQASPSTPASAFVGLLTSFTVDSPTTQPATPATNQAVTPTATQSTAQTTPITQQLGSALSRVYIQFSLDSIKTDGASLVTIAETEQTRLAALQNGLAQCVQAYNSAVTYQQNQNRIALDNARTSSNGFTNTALIGQVQDQGQYQLQLLSQQESTCEAAYPVMPSDMSSQIQDAINQIDDIRQQVQTGPVSDSEAISLLQQYNSLQSEIYTFNSSLPEPVAVSLPGALVSNSNTTASTKPQPVYFGGTITCAEVGPYNINCSDGTTCSTVGMNTLNCSGPGPNGTGIMTSCQGNFTMGGTVTCTQ